ncbi:carboxypeptidase regulatory-like domain-containing protein [Longimicrobium sp.]|uniref:carboxypeptidase regulatory-like domain-containing protein n=1 Tax=Longimicrobium sp. TaxID=2029185 RepID=UPI002E2EA9D4|nr:carboxypeptidase regulatory-like domain-containing protein [Longimicrobium sp.]HEX6039660.1 carboxypeptidase regulatory-like domain-containing protein [Longimicrobium sp.]
MTRLNSPLVLATLLSAAAAPLAAQGGALTGTVYDSLASAPLAGARVMVAGTDRAATTDAAGAFRIPGLPAGEYGVVFDHPRMDNLGWIPDTLRARVADGAETPVELAIPSLIRLGVLGCRGEAGPGTSVAVGRVADLASGEPVGGARVSFSWAGTAPRLESAATARVRTEAVADAQGLWYACDLPAHVQIVARVDHPGFEARAETYLFERPSAVHTDFMLTRGGRGQTAFLTGRVLSQQDGSPLQGAIVAIEGTNLSAMSDDLGYWELSNVPPGERMLRVRHAGAERMLPVEVSDAGVADVEIRVPPNAYTLAPITVTAARNLGILHGFYERRQGGTVGQYITRGEIQRRGAFRVTDLLAGMRRGQERCGPLLFVDGVLVHRADELALKLAPSETEGSDADGASDTDVGAAFTGAAAPLDYLDVGDVEGVEYYQTGLSAPAEFLRGDGRCSVFAVWTRRGGAPVDPDN